ncbi:hypothetical protein [Dyadobacter sp. NIV53]|uniref:hypothetical protein n=1 Tax=Dyadobacter sp. NIV53 TaxID=2861765 RepID=UPI001E3E6DE6|nr:hypothetical protein [Dyadobacter sp. NIV53]
MKKLFFVSALSLFSWSAFSQDAGVNKAVVDQFRKDKEKAIKTLQIRRIVQKQLFGWKEQKRTKT